MGAENDETFRGESASCRDGENAVAGPQPPGSPLPAAGFPSVEVADAHANQPQRWMPTAAVIRPPGYFCPRAIPAAIRNRPHFFVVNGPAGRGVGTSGCGSSHAGPRSAASLPSADDHYSARPFARARGVPATVRPRPIRRPPVGMLGIESAPAYSAPVLPLSMSSPSLSASRSRPRDKRPCGKAKSRAGRWREPSGVKLGNDAVGLWKREEHGKGKMAPFVLNAERKMKRKMWLKSASFLAGGPRCLRCTLAPYPPPRTI